MFMIHTHTSKKNKTKICAWLNLGSQELDPCQVTAPECGVQNWIHTCNCAAARGIWGAAAPRLCLGAAHLWHCGLYAFCVAALAIARGIVQDAGALKNKKNYTYDANLLSVLVCLAPSLRLPCMPSCRRERGVSGIRQAEKKGWGPSPYGKFAFKHLMYLHVTLILLILLCTGCSREFLYIVIVTADGG